jgi:tellurite resistance protein TehA-like permease
MYFLFVILTCIYIINILIIIIFIIIITLDNLKCRIYRKEKDNSLNNSYSKE